MVSLAFAIAASANFPVLFMSVLWKDCTTRGAVIGGFLGLISSVRADDRLAVGVGGDARQPEGLGAVPVRLAGAVLDDDRLRRHLAVLDARPQRARAASTATASWRSRCARRPASARRGVAGTDAATDADVPARRPRRGHAAIGPPTPDAADAAPRERRELLSLMTSRVRDACVRKPFYVDGALDLVAVCRAAVAARARATRWCATASASASSPPPTCATRCCGRSRRPSSRCARSPRFDLVASHADADLFEALLLMLRHRVHRVLVRDGDTMLGVLGQLDLMALRRQPLAPDRAADRRRPPASPS